VTMKRAFGALAVYLTSNAVVVVVLHRIVGA
jgi:hypothetical protein